MFPFPACRLFSEMTGWKTGPSFHTEKQQAPILGPVKDAQSCGLYQADSGS
jgi:hypothetical protein